MKKYLSLLRNERIEASQVIPDSLVFFHIERWNGSYERKIISVENFGDKTTLTDQYGQKYLLFSTTPVWVREYEEKEGLNIAFIVTVLSYEPHFYKQIRSEDINDINSFMEKTKFPLDFTFHLEMVQKDIVQKGERAMVRDWKMLRYHWFEGDK